MDEEEALRFVERYPEGKKVTVYYDPDHPGNAVLLPGKMNTFALKAGIILFVAFAIGPVLWVGLSVWRWWP